MPVKPPARRISPISSRVMGKRGSGTEALQNAVNSQAQRIRELASEVEFLRTWEAKSRGKTKRAFCMSIVSLVLCLLFVVISFGSDIYLYYVEGTTNKLFGQVSELSEQITNEVTERQKLESELKEIERRLNALEEKSEQVQLGFEPNLPDGAAGTVETPPPLPCKIDDPATLPEDMPTLDGYVFSGWNTKPDGSGKEYSPGQGITLTKDLTLYAQWSPKPTPKPALEPTLEPTQVPTQEPEPTPPTMPPASRST